MIKEDSAGTKTRRRKGCGDQQLFSLSSKLAMLDLSFIRQIGTKEACAPGYHVLLLHIVAAWFHVSLMHCYSHALLCLRTCYPFFFSREIYFYTLMRDLYLEKSLISKISVSI